MQLRRVITRVRDDGTASFIKEPLNRSVPIGPMDFYMLWGTEADRTVLGSSDPVSITAPYWPAHGGTRFMLVRWAPHSVAFRDEEDPADVTARADRELPGLLSYFEADSLGMHTSDTVDYGVCLEGELWLGLDEERDVRLTPGTCVVQRGTRHVWENRSDEPALMMFVLVGADRTT